MSKQFHLCQCKFYHVLTVCQLMFVQACVFLLPWHCRDQFYCHSQCYFGLCIHACVCCVCAMQDRKQMLLNLQYLQICKFWRFDTFQPDHQIFRHYSIYGSMVKDSDHLSNILFNCVGGREPNIVDVFV